MPVSTALSTILTSVRKNRVSRLTYTLLILNVYGTSGVHAASRQPIIMNAVRLAICECLF